MLVELNSSIFVDQNDAQVWNFLTDPIATTPRWDRSVAKIIPHSDAPVGVGWTATTVSPSGKRQEFRVTTYVPRRELTFALVSSRMFTRADLTFRLTPTPSGTRIDHIIDLNLRRRLLEPVPRLTGKRALGIDLGLLKRALGEFYGSPT